MSDLRPSAGQFHYRFNLGLAGSGPQRFGVASAGGYLIVVRSSVHYFLCVCCAGLESYEVYLRPRWNFKKANLDLFNAALEWSCATIPPDADFFLNMGPDKWIKRIMDNACLVTVPRSHQHRSKSQVYWWNDVIAQLRRSAIKARKAWIRGRHRLSPEAIADLRKSYGRANRLVKNEIRRAKNCAWRELMAAIDEDP